ncbi:MAG: tetratricopeptide repeat protein [Gammaproteobacteria bacterium]|nr:tetratricopeptide repeat protein [Gammaproteobacteria bacterium]
MNQSGKTEFILDNLIAGNVVPGVVHFYKGELYRQRKETGDTDLARQHYLQALQSDYFLPETYRSLGLLQLKEKRMPEARENLKRYLAASPDAEDREMIEYYLTMGQ